MATIERSLLMSVPPQRVYEAFVDLASWTRWLPHMREVRPLSEGPLAVGSRARLATKLGLASTWEVTRLEPGRGFAWESDVFPGVHVLFDHIAEPAEGGTRAVLRVETTGPLGFLAGLFGPLYARNLDHSLQELKRLLEGEGTGEAEAAGEKKE